MNEPPTKNYTPSRIEYSDNGWDVLGSWGVDYGRVAEEIRDSPKYTGHTVPDWHIGDWSSPSIRSDRLTAKYTF